MYKQLFLTNAGPQAPADVQVVFDSGALKAIISWTPTEGTLNYSVTASNRASKLNCVTSSTSCSIASLHCGSVYSICVIASNHAGSSKPTDSVSLKTGKKNMVLVILFLLCLCFNVSSRIHKKERLIIIKGLNENNFCSLL